MLALQFLHDFLHFHGCNLFYGWVSKLTFCQMDAANIEHIYIHTK